MYLLREKKQQYGKKNHDFENGSPGILFYSQKKKLLEDFSMK
jgi:hypothetical protein